MAHISVLQKEVLDYLDPKPNENFIDATVGGAGHASAILEKIRPNGKVLGIDADPEAIRGFKSKASNLKSKIIFICDNFVNLREIVKKQRFKKISGILFDLGISSCHLEESGRGFTFQKNEALDMRFNPENPLTAEKIVNYRSFQEIEKILKEYGEERFAEDISREIIETRKIKQIKTTFQLVEIIKKSVPGWYQNQRLHFATKTFQALRIAVNYELENLERALPQAVDILNKDGRLAVISFHSLEDRIVKNFFRTRALTDLRILTKKPVSPSQSEIKINPRARSAKLRAARKIIN